VNEIEISNGALVRTWLPPGEIEPGAMEQIVNSARHPEVADAIAIMPDCHVGYGVTIGCVFPTINAVVPNAVGVDIGCGMSAINTGVRLDERRFDRQFWRALSGDVQRNIPTGFAGNRTPARLERLDRPLRATELQSLVRDKAPAQLGTLGGGNHFLEAQVDEAGTVWFMVHSGSRHTGLRIANHYHTLAVANSQARGLDVGRDLSSLPLDDQVGQDYLVDMTWAAEFALESRLRMVRGLVQIFADRIERLGILINPEALPVINIPHNVAGLEMHGGRTVMVHRKGATSANLDEMGIIPGSMGSPSYIVRGRGNPLSFNSCSHGAGRRMGRKRAKEQITQSDFERSLQNTFSKASMTYVDEAPGAYKPIETVIERQQDLVEIVHTLRPIITVKGDSKARED